MPGYDPDMMPDYDEEFRKDKQREENAFMTAVKDALALEAELRQRGRSSKQVDTAAPTKIDYVQNWRDLDAEAYAILDMAQQEYASQADRFENFRILSALSGVPVRQVILLLMSKHLVSIQKGISIRESMKGRYCDVMNYLRLLYAWDCEEGK